MNGAESLARTLVASGVDVCFTNPGTSEMHFVAALDRVAEMRCVLALFEGVVTGAADGYARMTGRPASTLLHLAPGLGNGLANLHNASRARSPVVNVIGDHATYHKQYDAPLNADIEGVARPYSKWLRTSKSAADVARDGAEAVAAARTAPGQIATLILPADTAWNEGSGVVAAQPVPPPAPVASSAVERAAALLKGGGKGAILLAGAALQRTGLARAGRIAAATGAELLAPYSIARIERGAGIVPVDRVPYPIDQAVERLKHLSYLILVGAPAPVSFFAYPGKPSVVTPKECVIHTLARPEEDLLGALDTLADAVDARDATPALQQHERQPTPSGPVTLQGIGGVIASLIAEGMIVVDESITSGRSLLAMTRGCPPHDWLPNPGGSIGFAMPVAVGAAVACPDRKVLCLEGDGSGMYTLQSLWTMAREKLNVTTILFANRTYQILKGELANVGAGNPGRRALDMLEIGRPDLDWVGLAHGMGVPAWRAETLDDLRRHAAAGLASQGPSLVELVL
ncbi:MAG TPA: acetolactate synthase large subunit [Stellaceae bacterium]|nr:acetolactate synthase large subunit [Stellaceae bacterium]